MDFQYPAGGSYTNSWTPDSNPSIGSGKDRLSGYTGDLISDGVTLYVYQVADARWKYVLNFSFLSEDDLDDLESFLAVVGGSAFDYRDGPCGPVTSYVKVQLAQEGFVRTWRTSARGRWTGTVVLLEAA